MILVAGGTGRLGAVLVPKLTASGHEVRVLTRDPARAEHLGPSAAEIVVGDVRDPAGLDAAFQGVHTVVSAVHGFAGPGRVTPASVDRDGNANLVAAAAAAGADVVMVSVVGASPDSPMVLFRAKYEAEQHLQRSGVPWTVVRSTAFVELWAEIMTKPIVLGRGDNPINFVSVRDVATVVARAVGDKAERGRVIEVGGPQNLTFNELSRLLHPADGSEARVRHVPRWVLRSLSPVARQARAAHTMDTVDMTFDASSAGDLPLTDVRAALATMA